MKTKPPALLRLGIIVLFLVGGVFGYGCQETLSPQKNVEPVPLGKSKQSIINGQKDFTHPAIGAIVSNKTKSSCTGTLISPQLVLTAAHCVISMKRLPIQKWTFRIDFPTTGDKYKSEYLELAQWAYHPTYNTRRSPDYDIAVLVLKQKYTKVQPIPILKKAMEKSWVQQTVRVYGYGYIQTTPKYIYATAKYAADIPIFSIQTRSFTHYDSKTPKDKRKSACHGDSGGPALFKVNGHFRIVGVTSVAYRASMGTNRRTRCDGGAISARPDVNLDFLSPFLRKYPPPALSCKEDKECSSCEKCDATKQMCAPKPITSQKTTCAPCQVDADCGQGICKRFPNGSRCLQPCESSSCCPGGYYCGAGRGTSSSQSVCIPNKDVCPDFACKLDTDCGLGEHCDSGFCRPKRPKPIPELCRPCYSSSQCGKGNFCLGSTTAAGYCVQGCGVGDFCPDGFTCKVQAPGVKQCIPTQGCFVSCKTAQDCASGYMCKSGKCQRSGGGKDGDFCSKQFPCFPGYSCLTESKGISRCTSFCGPRPGMAGSLCDNSRCGVGMRCINFGSFKACLTICTPGSRCANGGRCTPLTRTTSVCLCQTSQQCNRGQICNTSVFGRYGACTKEPSKDACQPGQTCANTQGNYRCLGEKGDRKSGQTCGPFARCRKGLQCTRLTGSATYTCHQPCQNDANCGGNGKCTYFGSRGRWCYCRSDNDCSGNRICKRLFKSGNNSYGHCQDNGKSVCTNDINCPAEYKCDQNKCVYDPSKKNEPFPEDTREKPQENKAEKTPEETSKEPDTADAGPDEAPIEKAKPESKEPEKSALPPKDLTPPVIDKGCGCQLQQGHGQKEPFIYLFSLLVFIFFSHRQKKQKNISPEDTSLR